jgi:hypothetical protein
MIDHVLARLVEGLRQSFESALLQRQAVEERFQVDVFLGDVSFETSYSLPGEDRPARIRVDVSLDWPTWSQTAYRSRSLGEEPEEQPEILVEIAFRVQDLARVPDLAPVLAVLPDQLLVIGDDPLLRGPPTVEQVFAEEADDPDCAVEVSYEGTCVVDDALLDHHDQVAEALAPLGRAVASILVRMADLPFSFHPPEGHGT